MGQCHIIIHPDLRPAVERVARILTSADVDVGVLHRIETDQLAEGYHGVMQVVVDGDSIRFKRDGDV